MLDIEPLKLKPTWRNNRCAEDRIAMRIDHFLVAEQIVDRPLQIRQWVGCGGASDHFPIFLDLNIGPKQPPSPLKFNSTWLKDDSFKALILARWIPYRADSNLSTAFHFAENFKRIKEAVKTWSASKRLREYLDLKQVEEELRLTYEGIGGGFLSQADKDALVSLEKRRNSLLMDKEESWRLKSRAT